MKNIVKYFKNKYQSIKFIQYYIRESPVLQSGLGVILASLFFESSSLLVAVPVSILVLRKKCIFFLIATIVGWGYFHWNFEVILKQRVSAQVSENNIVCRVDEDPIIKDFTQQVVCEISDTGIKTLLEVPKYPIYSVGDILQVNVRLIIPDNSAEFKEQDYLKGRGIYLKGRANLVQLIDQEVSLSSQMATVRSYLRDKIFSGFSFDSAALLSGLILGTKEEFSGDFEQMLSNTSMAHIIAVSGSNVSMLLGAYFRFSGLISRKLLYNAAYLVLILFGMLVGLGNLPALRAVIMGIILVINLQLGRPQAVVITLVGAICLMVIVNPYVWLSLSFQLSVSAFISITFLAKVITKRITSLGGLAEPLGVMISVLVGTLPITYINFKQASVSSIPANIIILPLVVPALFVGIISLGAYLLQIFGYGYFLHISDLLLKLVINSISVFGKIPGGVLTDPKQVFTLYGLIILIFIYADFKSTVSKN